MPFISTLLLRETLSVLRIVSITLMLDLCWLDIYAFYLDLKQILDKKLRTKFTIYHTRVLFAVNINE